FPSAGTYSVVDATTGNTGLIEVPVVASPTAGDTLTPFTVQWSTTPPPAGYDYDVQIERPGGQWTDLIPNTSTTQTTFTPDAGPGTYSFQARVENTSSQIASQWSPALTIPAAAAAADLKPPTTGSPDPEPP